MADETSAAGGQTPPPSAPATGQTPATGSQTTVQPRTSSEDDAPMSVAEARKLREELKQRRETEAAAQAELKKLRDTQLTEEQRKEAQREAQEKQLLSLQQERQTWLLDRAVLLAAPHVGIDPELAQKLINLSDIETDKDGEPKAKSVEEALKKLLERFPQLAVNPVSQNQPPRLPAPRVPPTNPPASSVGQQPQYNYKNRPGWGSTLKKPS